MSRPRIGGPGHSEVDQPAVDRVVLASERVDVAHPVQGGSPQECTSEVLDGSGAEAGFGEERTVATSSCSNSSGTLNCRGETPQVLGCACWTCLLRGQTLRFCLLSSLNCLSARTAAFYLESLWTFFFIGAGADKGIRGIR